MSVKLYVCFIMTYRYCGSSLNRPRDFATLVIIVQVASSSVTSRLRAQRNNVELGSTVRTILRCSVINRVNCEASPVSQRTWPNGKLVRFWSCGICFDSESGQISDFTIAVLSFPPWRSAFEGTEWRTSRQVYLLCLWERHLTGFSHFGVVDRWPVTLKRARIAHWSLSRDRKINTQINTKKHSSCSQIVVEIINANRRCRKLDECFTSQCVFRPCFKCMVEKCTPRTIRITYSTVYCARVGIFTIAHWNEYFVFCVFSSSA